MEQRKEQKKEQRVYAAFGRGLHHREGGVAAGTHHQVGLELIQNFLGLALGAAQVAQSLEVMLNARPVELPQEAGDGDGADGVALSGHQLPFHAAICPYKEDVCPVPFPKHTGQRHGWVNVSGGAAAGKQDFHRKTPRSDLSLFLPRSPFFRCGDLSGY